MLVSVGPRGDTHMRPRGNPRWDLEATRNDRGFLALPTETSFTTPHYYPQYEVWAIEFFWQDPFKGKSNSKNN